MNVLTVDIGGTNVKILATGQAVPRKFPSGRTLTPQQMVSEVNKLAHDWEYDVVSIGYPGIVAHGQPSTEPRNLGPGWVGFDFAAPFRRPVKLMNDAAMQAVGSYRGGRMLLLGLGTGLGSTLVVDDIVVPMEWGHLSYKNGTVEDYVGARGLKRLGKKKWSRHVARGIVFMNKVFHVDDVVLGGGNAKKLLNLPEGCRIGSNANAFVGGFRMWEESSKQPFSRKKPTVNIATGREQLAQPRAWRSA